MNSMNLQSTLGLVYRRWGRARWDGSAQRVLQAARATMMRKRYCVIATYASEGIHARVVQPYPPRSDFSVLLGTSRSSRKVEEIESDPRTSLIYQDDARAACVTLVGRAEVLGKRKAEAKKFMPSWTAFWPRGPDDPDFVNVLFVPHAIEVWDGLRGITPEPFGLVSARLERCDDQWTLQPSHEGSAHLETSLAGSE